MPIILRQYDKLLAIRKFHLHSRHIDYWKTLENIFCPFHWMKFVSATAVESSLSRNDTAGSFVQAFSGLCLLIYIVRNLYLNMTSAGGFWPLTLQN